MHRPALPTAALLLSLITLGLGCATGATSSSTSIRSADFNTRLGATGDVVTLTHNATGLALRSDRGSYRAGAPISLQLVNDGASTYGLAIEHGSCATPTAVWLKNQRGDTFFVRSGAHDVCEDSRPIAPGSSASLVTVDSDVVWFDRSSEESLYRLPRSLPAGRYSVHALTPVGELMTTLAITPR